MPRVEWEHDIGVWGPYRFILYGTEGWVALHVCPRTGMRTNVLKPSAMAAKAWATAFADGPPVDWHWRTSRWEATHRGFTLTVQQTDEMVPAWVAMVVGPNDRSASHVAFTVDSALLWAETWARTRVADTYV